MGCADPTCWRPLYRDGWCQLHWTRHVWLPSRPTCEEPGCERPKLMAQFCARHHQKHYRLRKRLAELPEQLLDGITRYGTDHKVRHLGYEGFTLCGYRMRQRMPARAKEWQQCRRCLQIAGRPLPPLPQRPKGRRKAAPPVQTEVQSLAARIRAGTGKVG